MSPILPRVVAVLQQHGYRLFMRPYELNIVGLRAKRTQANRFDDEIHVFFKTEGKGWTYLIFPATTDPGTYWLNNPLMPQGTAILRQGQYVNAYALGSHKGQKALVQVGTVAVIRDYDRNATLDLDNGRVEQATGINIHRAARAGTTRQVDKYSAGCQVFANADDFDRFLERCEQHRARYGNRFTYTLIDFRAMRRQTYRRLAIGASLAVGLASGIALLKGPVRRILRPKLAAA